MFGTAIRADDAIRPSLTFEKTDTGGVCTEMFEDRGERVEVSEVDSLHIENK